MFKIIKIYSKQQYSTNLYCIYRVSRLISIEGISYDTDLVYINHYAWL